MSNDVESDAANAGPAEPSAPDVRPVAESVGFNLDDLVREHHEKYDSRVELPDKVASDKPSRYYQDVAARAEKSGKTVAAIRELDEQFISSSRFPSPSCLKPDQVLQMAGVSRVAGDALSPEQAARLNPLREHLDSCLYCQLLVATSEPDVETLDRIVGRMKLDFAPAQPTQSTEQDATPPLRIFRTFSKLVTAGMKRRHVLNWGGPLVAIVALVFLGLLAPDLSEAPDNSGGDLALPHRNFETSPPPPAPVVDGSGGVNGIGIGLNGGVGVVATSGDGAASGEVDPARTEVLGLYLRGIAKSVATSPVDGLGDFSLATRLHANHNAPQLHAPPLPVPTGNGAERSPNMQSYEVLLNTEIDLITPGTGTRTLMMRPDLNMLLKSDDNPKNLLQGDSPAVGAAPRPAGTTRGAASTGAAAGPAKPAPTPGSPR